MKEAILAAVVEKKVPEQVQRYFRQRIETLPNKMTDEHIFKAIDRAVWKISGLKRLRLIELDPELLKFVAVQAKGSVRVVERWHPHRLRHSAATRIRREHGLEAARVILGHSSAVTSELEFE